MSYTFFNIPTSYSIGDSLSTVNLNYETLDTWIGSVQLSAQNLWKPLVEYYQVKSILFKNAAAIGTLWKPSWDNCVTQVQINSAKWLEPVVVFYPVVLTGTDLAVEGFVTSRSIEQATVAPTTEKKITKWLNDNFSANSGLGGSTAYIENQIAYVYALKQESSTPISTVRLLQDTGACSTNDVTITTYCTNHYSGYVYCSNGDFNCNGQSNGCNQSATCPCSYPQTGTHYYNPVIRAYLNFNYSNNYESSNISCLVYIMQNCKWIYSTQI